MAKVKQVFVSGFLILIRVYQVCFSPWLGQRCRFYPSCSQYAIESLKARGILAGLWLASKRVCRCHPGCEGGYDPIEKIR